MSQLALYFLGTPRLERDHTLISLGQTKALALLSYLALTHCPHTRDALATVFWPDHDSSSARGELRRIVWVLNKSLGKGWLDTERQTVELPHQADLWLDVDQFRTLLACGQAHGHRASDVCPACLEPLTEAVELVRGDFLAGFTLPDCLDFDTWQTFETEALRRELSGALERLVRLHGPSAPVATEQGIAYARRWLMLDPLNEAAHRCLMQLYIGSGQPTTALRQYQACIQALKEELGTSPSAETTALYEAIKGNRLSSPSQVAAPEGGAAGGQNLSQNPILKIHPEHNLPAQPTPFIGREQEVAAVCRLLTQDTPPVRLVTLTGTGGIGKTRLGLQVAVELLEHFADGVFFVPLADLSDPNLLVSAIARQLDVREGGSQPVLEILKSALREKCLLLVLDNFEQIITAAPLVAELLAVAPKLKVLVTSRALLHLRGEYEFPVPPLKLPERTQVWSLERLRQYETVQMFVERAQAARADFTLTSENALAVAEICHHLDGLPLAIELAAARVKLLPPQALLARLSSRLTLLTGGAQDMPARQQTLRNTIDWSYSLLNEAEQILFSRLAVFVGSFTLETAEAICNSDDTLSGAVGHLVAGPGHSPSTLPTVTGQTLNVLEGVTSLFNNSLLVQQDTSGNQPRFRMLETIREYALERLQESNQLEALRQQHAHYFAEQIDEIGTNFHFYAGLRLDWAEEEHDNLRAMLTWSQGRSDEVELGLRMVGTLFWFWYRRGYFSEGRAWCQRFTASTSQNRWRVGRASLLLGSGSMALLQGDLAEAGRQLQEGVTISRELEDERWLAPALLAWGALALHQGDMVTAQHIFEETLVIGKRFNRGYVIANSLLNLGNVAVAHGDYSTARDLFEQAAALAKTNDNNWLVANALNNLGEVARIQGDDEQAQRSYEESQALFSKTGDKPDVARSLHSLGYVAQHQGDYDRAEACFRESLIMFQELGNKRGIIECLAGLASLAAAQGQPQGAARLLAAAEAQLSASGAAWWPADRVEYERNLSAIQAALDQETLAATWAEGQAMTLAEAIAYASTMML